MNLRWLQLALVAVYLCAGQFGADAQSASAGLRFEVWFPSWLSNTSPGRLFVVLAKTNAPEPRFALGQTGPNAPVAIAMDVDKPTSAQAITMGSQAFIFPLTNLASLTAGSYFIQAVFDSNPDLRFAGAPGNLYSTMARRRLDPATTEVVSIELNQVVPEETFPPDTAQLKFIKIRSRLLSDFHGRPIFLRAAVVLPRDYDAAGHQRYPLWVRIGGFNTRCTVVTKLMDRKSEFRKTWMDRSTPKFILLQLDGAGPFGDPYYVNSANNGPWGDALVQELIPHVERQFGGIGNARSRVLSGSSTGGWVSLALQIFYPDFFNGTWSSCPDPVDFRALELINLYADTNAYVNRFGNERPSERDLNGDVRLTTRREVCMENLLARGSSYVRSGEQWGAWTAVFSPKGPDGLPMAPWDPITGEINRKVTEQWKRYDLNLYLQKNWKQLALKLGHKIHIAAGESDQYFLNNAVYLLDDWLRTAEPPFQGSIVYGSRQGHGWFNLSLAQTLRAMEAATKE